MEKMETYAKRLDAAMKRKDISAPSLAAKIGTTRQAIGQVLNEKSKTLGVVYHLAAAKALGIDPDWLATGEGSKSNGSYGIAVKTTPDSVTIPQYNTGGKMGNGLVLRDQAGIINGWNVNNEWLSKNVPHCTSPKNLAIVTGFGDSMRGIFNSGDPLIVDTGVTTCDYDGIYFFRVGNEGFIKRLQRIPSVGIRVISENKSYEAWDIKGDMDFEVFAKVLRAWKGESY